MMALGVLLAAGGGGMVKVVFLLLLCLLLAFITSSFLRGFLTGILSLVSPESNKNT
jgi:hypothetical protein